MNLTKEVLKEYFKSWKEIGEYTEYHSRIEADLNILLDRPEKTKANTEGDE